MTVAAPIGPLEQVSEEGNHVVGIEAGRVAFEAQMEGQRFDEATLDWLNEQFSAPLVVPIALVRHHVRRHGVTYLADQTYLAPHPKELMLRNHV